MLDARCVQLWLAEAEKRNESNELGLQLTISILFYFLLL